MKSTTLGAVVLLSLAPPLAGSEAEIASGARRAALSRPERIYLVASDRDHALISTMVRDDASVLSIKGENEDAARELAAYLGNENLFPRERPKTVVFVGAVAPRMREIVEWGIVPRGYAVESIDPIDAMARRGPAGVVWYDSPHTMPLAAYWAHRAETVHRTRYVVVGSEADYLALEARGAIVPTVMDFGGKFPVAVKRRLGWLVNGVRLDAAEAETAPVAGVVTSLATYEEMYRENDAMMELHRRLEVAAMAETPGRTLELGTYLIGDPIAKLPAPNPLIPCPSATRFTTGIGACPDATVGIPWVKSVRRDGVPLSFISDFRPFGTSGVPVYGNHVATGNFQMSPDGRDEIATTRGGDPSGDTTCKIYKVDGTQITSFFAFGVVGDAQTHGATVAAGHLLGTGSVRDNLVFGRGPGSAFGPNFRVFTYNTSTSSWQKTYSYTVSFTTCPAGGCKYGVALTAGDFDGDGWDEIAAAKGPGLTSEYDSQVRVFDAHGGSVSPIPWLVIPDAFQAYTPARTYGATLGSGDFDDDGYDDLAVGKGPGDGAQLGGYPNIPDTTMDTTIAIRKSVGTTFLYRGETLNDPFGMMYWATKYPPVDGILAGAVATGYDGDGVAGSADELLVAQGPAWSQVTGNNGEPPDFLGSRIRGFAVNTSGNPWTFTQIIESLVHDAEQGGGTLETLGKPSTRGMRIARIKAPALSNPFAFAPGARALSAAGQDQPPQGELPAWPWLPSREAARDVLRFFNEIPEDLLRSPGSKTAIVVLMSNVHDHLVARRFSEADVGLVALKRVLAAEVVNLGTLVDLDGTADLLRRAVAQEVGNRPPVAVATADHVHRVPWDTTARVQLEASMSSDPDSTPGTANNIRSYRWIDARRWLLGTDPEVIVELGHDASGATEHVITLEVEDAYGGIGRTTTRVTILGTR